MSGTDSTESGSTLVETVVVVVTCVCVCMSIEIFGNVRIRAS